MGSGKQIKLSSTRMLLALLCTLLALRGSLASLQTPEVDIYNVSYVPPGGESHAAIRRKVAVPKNDQYVSMPLREGKPWEEQSLALAWKVRWKEGCCCSC